MATSLIGSPVEIVDVDVHAPSPTLTTLEPYLDATWLEFSRDPLTIEVNKRVPFRPATAKIVEHACARRKPERQLAPPKIEYPPEPEPLEDDPLDGPLDYQLYRVARLLGTR